MYKNTILINTSKSNHNDIKKEIMGTKIMKPNKYGYFEDCLEGFLHFGIENDNYDLDEIIYYIVSLGFKEAEIEIYDDEFLSNLVYSTTLPYSIEKKEKISTFSNEISVKTIKQLIEDNTVEKFMDLTANKILNTIKLNLPCRERIDNFEEVYRILNTFEQTIDILLDCIDVYNCNYDEYKINVFCYVYDHLHNLLIKPTTINFEKARVAVQSIRFITP